MLFIHLLCSSDRLHACPPLQNIGENVMTLRTAMPAPPDVGLNLDDKS